jgi:hypothetical protein
MPSYPNRGALQAAIVARVAAGETVAGVCAGDPAMPSADSVRGWARADAGFAAALAGARRRGAFARGVMFREEVAAAFLARVAAGATVASLLGRPGMPSQGAYRHWRRTQVAFQETLWRLRGARYGRQSGQGHARFRGWDAAAAARIVRAVRAGARLRRMLAARPELPCLAVVERWRRERPDWDRVLRAAMAEGRLERGRRVGMPGGGRCSAALANDILDRVMDGASLRGLAGEAGMPCQRTLYAWKAKRRSFGEEVAKARMIGKVSGARVRALRARRA